MYSRHEARKIMLRNAVDLVRKLDNLLDSLDVAEKSDLRGCCKKIESWLVERHNSLVELEKLERGERR